MNNSEVFTRIVTRAEADNSGLGSLFYASAPLVTTIAWDDVIGSKVSPYITMAFVSSDNIDDGFDTDVTRWQWDFNVWIKKEIGISANVGAGIVDRLYGNATTQSDLVPDWGFHRYEFGVTLTSGWDMTSCYHVASAEAHELDYLHFIETFEVLLSRSP